jgi:hypothetical protein
MQFGLKLDAGVILRLDDKDIGQGLRFSRVACSRFLSRAPASMRYGTPRTFTVGASEHEQ